VLPSAVLALIVMVSLDTGFLLGSQRGESDLVIVPASFSSSSGSNDDSGKLTVSETDAHEVGRLQAEILRLQVLLLRLAEVAGLDDGEFDLQSEPLSSLAPSAPTTLALVNQDLVHMSEQGERMQAIFSERLARHESRISGSPVNNRVISSRFGFRADPDTGESRLHRGVDFSGPVGEPIMAIASGVVTYAGMNGGYGNLVELEHANGYRTRYAHNHTVLVSLGSLVKKGQQIATLGSTGRSTGPHLHFEVRQHGKALDPQHFIR